MAGQILFFEKNKADFSYGSVTASASEGNEFAPNVLNRNNTTAWLTTGSLDANETTLTINLGDPKSISDIILIKHNFKAFTIRWWDGDQFQDFNTPINETENVLESNYFEVSAVETTQIQVTIFGTQIPDSDKHLFQLILTEKIGRLEGWPAISKPVLSKNRKQTEMLSGKTNIFENVGNFSCILQFKRFSSDADLSLIEELHSRIEGFLFWPCGGNENQFRTVRQGYRMQDIFLMRPSDEYSPEYDSGFYKGTISQDLKLEEVIE
jgi:hypothetical protein